MDFELTAEQAALRARARELADGVFAERAARWDEREEYPWDNVKELAAAGFMGMTIPREHGGGDRPILDVVLVIEEIARACGVTGRIVVEGNLGVVGALRAYGTEAQKRRYFPLAGFLFGGMDARLLYESPFTDLAPRGPDALFTSKEVDELVAVIRQVREAAIAA